MKKALAASLVLAACAAGAQEAEITFESTELAPGVFMTVGIHSEGGFGGGNHGWVAGEDFVAMIDDGIPPGAENLVKHIAAEVGRPVDFMINTHYHGDHTGANAAFAAEDTIVFAHYNIRKRLLEDPDSAGGPGGMPVVTFDDGVTFYLNGYKAEVIHMAAAHTDGDAIVVVPEANVIFAGDCQFRGLFPYIDLDGGGSVDGFISAQKAIAALADDNTRIVPGHGPLSSLAELQRDLAMLEDARSKVAALIDEGMSEDEAAAAEPLAEYAEEFNWGFISAERLTRTIYKSLTAGS